MIHRSLQNYNDTVCNTKMVAELVGWILQSI